MHGQGLRRGAGEAPRRSPVMRSIGHSGWRCGSTDTRGGSSAPRSPRSRCPHRVVRSMSVRRSVSTHRAVGGWTMSRSHPTRRNFAGLGALAAAVEAVRLAIEGSAPPSRYAALTMTDTLRRAVIAKLDGRPSMVISGHAEDGGSLSGDGHTYYLAFGGDERDSSADIFERRKRDPFIRTMAIWAPDGLDDDALGAIGRLRRLSGSSFAREFRPCRVFIEAMVPVSRCFPRSRHQAAAGAPSRRVLRRRVTPGATSPGWSTSIVTCGAIFRGATSAPPR